MMNKQHNYYKPPLVAEKILDIMLSHSESESLCGDFEDIYNEIANKKGRVRAWMWYWLQIIAYLPDYLSNIDEIFLYRLFKQTS